MSKIWDALQKLEQTARHSAQDIITNPFAIPDNTDELLTGPESLPQIHSGDECPPDTDLDYPPIREVWAQHFGRIIYHSDPASPGADKFRLLRMRLRSLWTAGKLKSLLITSPLPKDGKTTIALNLATALAEQRAKRVLLVDADLHRGSVVEQLGLAPELGLAECLQDGVNPHCVLRRVEPLGWYFLSAGKLQLANPTELLRPQEISGIVRTLSPHFDWILVDSPPLLSLTDPLSLAQALDGTLLVARAGVTPSKAVGDAISLLGKKHVVGLALNRMDEAAHPYSKYQNYYRDSKARAVDGDDSGDPHSQHPAEPASGS